MKRKRKRRPPRKLPVALDDHWKSHDRHSNPHCHEWQHGPHIDSLARESMTECPCCKGIGCLETYDFDGRPAGWHQCTHCMGRGKVEVESWSWI